MRAVIVAGDTDGNLGDRAILAATIDLLRRIEPRIDVQTVSSAPADMAGDLGIKAFPRGSSGMPGLLRAAARADVVMIGGGGLFQDDDSLVKMPYWAMRTALLRRCNRNLVGWSLGVGPLRAASSRAAARSAFACMKSLSVRDDQAAAVAAPLTRLDVAVIPDPAICLEPASSRQARQAMTGAGIDPDCGPVVGVALRRWFPPRARIVPHKIASRLGFVDESEKTTTDLLCRRIGHALDKFLAQHGGQVVLMPSYAFEHEGDRAMAGRIRSAMTSDQVKILSLTCPRLYKAVCGELDLMVGGRMHPTILASSMGTPVCGLAYNPKFRGYFAHLGAGDLVLDVGEIVEEDGGDHLFSLVEQAFRHGPIDPDRITAIKTRVEARLHEQLASLTA